MGVFLIAGPSGVGKGTLEQKLRAARPELWWSVSVTTRSPRPGERPGVDYHFVSDEVFDRMIAAGEFLEWAPIFGHRSGTPRLPLEDALGAGRPVLIEVDVQGVRAIKEALPDAVSVLVAPPSLDELRRRLAARRTEDPERTARRLARAEEELAAASEFDHVIVNDEIETAWRQIAGIIGGSERDDVRKPRP